VSSAIYFFSSSAVGVVVWVYVSILLLCAWNEAGQVRAWRGGALFRGRPPRVSLAHRASILAKKEEKS
jgi:hypothetical protein